KAANKGDITSEYSLGQIYEKGQGIKQDYSKAMSWYKKSAANDDDVSAPGVIESMSSIANLYANGLGVTKDYQQAEQWYQKAFNASQKEVALLKQNS
ncbi:tetratricopeptide repeat protein, partial [Oenococcus oeni]